MAGYGRTAFSGATSGIGQALGSLMLGDRAQQAGFDAETTAQTKMGQALALIQQAQANARLHDAQAVKAAEEAAVLQRRPGIADEVIAASSGVDVPTLNSYRTTQRTGQAPQVPMGPPDEMGGMGQGAAKFGPESSSRMGQALARLLPILNNEKDINPEQYAKAAGEYGEQDLRGDMLAGRKSPQAVALAQGALKGGPVFHFDTSGQVGNLFTGALDGSSPRALAVTDKEKQSAGAQRANAVQSYAAAGASNASAAKTRTEMNDGMGRGGKAPAGYRWAADGTSLESIPGGPADKQNTSSDGERKAGSLLMRLRGSQAQMLAAVGKSPKSEKPIPAAEFVRAIPWVGGDTAANLMTNEARQQVEAAQLDMLDAALTLGTGAAYTNEQLRGYAKSFFPQIGDLPKTLADKRVRLTNVIHAAEIAAGRSAKAAKPGAAPALPGGAGGDWGDEPPPDQRVVPVRY